MAQLNDVARPSVVASRDLNDHLWSFINDHIQSLPAFVLSNQVLGRVTCFVFFFSKFVT